MKRHHGFTNSFTNLFDYVMIVEIPSLKESATAAQEVPVDKNLQLYMQ
jgi:hypothetical protein